MRILNDFFFFNGKWKVLKNQVCDSFTPFPRERPSGKEVKGNVLALFAIIKYHRSGWLKEQKCISHSSEGCQVRDQRAS